MIQQTGIVTASNFGGYPAAAPGSFIEIYGSNLAGAAQAWGSGNFNGINAPTSLGGVYVTINNVPAYVSYVSPTQVNVQVPANVPTEASVSVVVTYNGEASTSVNLAMRPYEAGLLAPPSFNVGGKQYVEAFHADGGIVSNGKIPNVPSSPAAPGETIVFYGVEFWPRHAFQHSRRRRDRKRPQHLGQSRKIHDRPNHR